MSKCFVCHETITKNSFRMDYRIKVSTSLRDQKRFHAPQCAAGIPLVSRARDCNILRRWLLDPAQIEAAPMLRDTLALL
jgi:hypothetical protein